MRKLRIPLLLAVLPILLLLIGCSSDNPMDSNDQAVLEGARITYGIAAGDPTQFAAKVATCNNEQNMLTFMGNHDTVVAIHNCIIVRLQNDGETPVPFVDINPGDSVKVYGEQYQNGYVYAHRIEICNDCIYDVAFHDTIVAVDYNAGTFMVKNRTETITVDENTIIWGVITRNFYKPVDEKEAGGPGNSLCDNPGFYTRERDTLLNFTDLQEGDVVEVKAITVDENNLLAVSVKLANCNDVEKSCVQFEAYLTSVDVDNKLVTFDGLNWIGFICKNALLLGLDGEALTLADFIVGDYVAVKGFPLEGDTLKVCEMTKINP